MEPRSERTVEEEERAGQDTVTTTRSRNRGLLRHRPSALEVQGRSLQMQILGKASRRRGTGLDWEGQGPPHPGAKGPLHGEGRTRAEPHSPEDTACPQAPPEADLSYFSGQPCKEGTPVIPSDTPGDRGTQGRSHAQGHTGSRHRAEFSPGPPAMTGRMIGRPRAQ